MGKLEEEEGGEDVEEAKRKGRGGGLFGPSKKQAEAEEERRRQEKQARRGSTTNNTAKYMGDISSQISQKRGRVCIRLPPGVREGEEVYERWNDGQVFSYIVPPLDSTFTHPEEPDVVLATVRPIGWAPASSSGSSSTDEEERERRKEELIRSRLRKSSKEPKNLGKMVKGGVQTFAQITLRDEYIPEEEKKITSMVEGERKTHQVSEVVRNKGLVLVERLEKTSKGVFCRVCKLRFPSDCKCGDLRDRGEREYGMQAAKVQKAYLMDRFSDYDAAFG